MTDLIARNLDKIRERIGIAASSSGRDLKDITLVAVSKTVDEQRIKRALSLGVTDIGENRVQEFLSKKDGIKADFPHTAFHIIGTLQTNKVKYVAGKVELIQSVNSLKLLEEIDKRSERVQNVLLEINIADEQTKTGIDAAEIWDILENAARFKRVSIKGLMAIPPIQGKEGGNRAYFGRMRNLFVDIKAKKYDNVCMDILSMGMSEDYCEAICEGSNMVRLGRAIFGDRE